LELYRPAGELLHQLALTPDWQPAFEWARLIGLCKYGIWVSESEAEPRVEPLWHPTGKPFIRGFRVFLAHQSLQWSAEFAATRYFADTARDAAGGLVTAGRVAAGEHVLYRTAAFAGRDPEEPVTALRFETAERPQPLGVKARDLVDVMADSVACGDRLPDDIEVLIPGETIREVVTLTEEAGGRETGGILIGHLNRDPGHGELCVEVTAQIAARHTVGNAVKLTFTSDTWTDVRSAIALRRQGELMCGWWHSHPSREWCKACPPERQRVCPLAMGFLSADDRALHRALFPNAFSLALLLTNAITGIESKLFGWRRGVLEPRGFRRMGADPSGVGTVVFSSLSSSPDLAPAVECATRTHPVADESPQPGQPLAVNGEPYAKASAS
jgi:hypothetical protein